MIKISFQKVEKGLYYEDDYHSITINENIIIGTYKDKIDFINLELAKKLVHDRKLVSNGKTYPVFVDLNVARDMDKEAKNYFSSPEALEGLSAVAILTKNAFHHFGASLYLLINKPKLPTELFLKKEKAIEWLKYFNSLN